MKTQRTLKLRTKNTVAINKLEFALGWSFTYHKTQGLTCPKLVLALGRRKSCRLGYNIKFEALYVRLSRVKRGADLKIWPTTRASLEYLKHLTVDEDKRLWDRGYTEKGKWRPREIRKQDLARQKEVMAALEEIEDYDALLPKNSLLTCNVLKRYLSHLHIGYKSNDKKPTLHALLRPKWLEARGLDQNPPTDVEEKKE